MKQRSANADEAAAIAAAIDRFVAETSPVVAAAGGDDVSPWQRAALLEGVSAHKMTIQDLEGGMQ